MAHTFEKAVKGATKMKLAPPKDKYIEQILVATRSGDAGVAEVFRTLQLRIRDSTWTIVFKALIVVHTMIRDGQRNVTLSFLSNAPQARLSTSDFTAVQTQGANIESYANYLVARARAFANTKQDHARDEAIRRLRDLTVAKGLLKETEDVFLQIRGLLKCQAIFEERNNSITYEACKLLLKDLIALYGTLNQAVSSLLIHFFELSNVDARKAVKLYKRFVKTTADIITFLKNIRMSGIFEDYTVPQIKEASDKMIDQLQAHVDDPDFENIRQQYLEGKSPTKARQNRVTEGKKKQEPIKAPPADLIDFFESIETTQNPFAQQQQAQPQQQHRSLGAGQPLQLTYTATGQQPFNYMPSQPTGFIAPQQTNPFLQSQQSPFTQQMQPQFTGMPMQSPDQFAQHNGYGFSSQQQIQPQVTSPAQLQPQPQPQVLVPQSTNPFRQSMMLPPQPLSAGQQLASVPNFSTALGNGTAFNQNQTNLTPLQTQRTGTNPFAKSAPASANLARSPSMLQPMVTGSTNPFRQSQFINQQTGRGWQNSGQQGTMGGLEQLSTVSVFPRPGQ